MCSQYNLCYSHPLPNPDWVTPWGPSLYYSQPPPLFSPDPTCPLSHPELLTPVFLCGFWGWWMAASVPPSLLSHDFKLCECRLGVVNSWMHPIIFDVASLKGIDAKDFLNLQKRHLFRTLEDKACFKEKGWKEKVLKMNNKVLKEEGLEQHEQWEEFRVRVK